jgi:hypothetical protein
MPFPSIETLREAGFGTNSILLIGISASILSGDDFDLLGPDVFEQNVRFGSWIAFLSSIIESPLYPHQRTLWPNRA